MKRIFLFLLFPLFLFGFLFGEEVLPNDAVVLNASEVHQGDFFATGKMVEISGTVVGDVYILATQAFVDGHVTGDILCCSGNVEISGVVDNNVRLLAGQATISGKVAGNVTAIGGSVALTSSAKILGNVVGVAVNVMCAAPIDGDAKMVTSHLRVSSHIKGNLSADVGKMRLTSRAEIGKNVDYSADTPADIESGAIIRGTVSYHPSVVQDIVEGRLFEGFVIGSKLAGTLMNFLYSLIVGLIMIYLFPKNLESGMHALSHHPWKSLAWGTILMILFPLLSLVLLMTILGVPFGLALIALNVIAFYTAKILTIFWGSDVLFKRFHPRAKRVMILCTGLVIYFLLCAIPIFGFILTLASMLFGLGASTLAALLHRKKRFHLR